MTSQDHTTIENAETIEEAVHLAVGAASACWENLRGAGTFQSEEAKSVADSLLRRVAKAQVQVEQHIHVSVPGMSGVVASAYATEVANINAQKRGQA